MRRAQVAYASCGAAMYRVISLGDYLRDPHLIYYLQGPHLIRVGLAELLILVAAAALVTPDAARAQTALPAPPPRPLLGGSPRWPPRRTYRATTGQAPGRCRHRRRSPRAHLCRL